MKEIKILLLLVLSFGQIMAQDEWITPFEKSGGLETTTYAEAIDYYKKLAKSSNRIVLRTEGLTDSGKPLHLLIYSSDSNFNFEEARSDNRRKILINNGIHPGEPCGVDASMMFFRELAFDKATQAMVGEVIIAAIPFYNIGGALNRGPHSRVNQEGPLEYGFRGNSRNYDLNRDFIKQDTRNARSFAGIFQKVLPDVFIDTHTSDGADYQHVMTLVEGQADKLGGKLGEYYRSVFLPLLYEGMNEKGFPMVPYVQTVERTPDNGIQGFYDSPRYSSGYAALFQSMAMISEAHMLKPFKDRVEGTHALLRTLVEVVNQRKMEIGEIRATALADLENQKDFPLQWRVDRERFSQVEFSGYEAVYKPSEISGKERLFYDRDKPWTKSIPHYNYYVPTISATRPKAYLIPQSWHNVIDNLRRNGVEILQLEKDSTIIITAYSISNYETRQRPYEGHYLHYNVEVESEELEMSFRKGDYIVPVSQARARYIVETLEPQGYDSFFAWNYFDTILQMKEYFDSYVFEDLAVEYLLKHPKLREELEAKKAEDPQFAENGRSQLLFIYQHSPHYESEHLRYPVYKVNLN